MGFYSYRVCECFWLNANVLSRSLLRLHDDSISFSDGQTSVSGPQLRGLISFWCRYPQHLNEVRHPRRDISCFYVCVATDQHGFFFYLSKIVKTSLAYYLKQRECFAWIRSLTFVEFCKCKLSEGYWYFWYLCCIFSMMYLCLRNHAGRRRNFSITHCTTRWHNRPF